MALGVEGTGTALLLYQASGRTIDVSRDYHAKQIIAQAHQTRQAAQDNAHVILLQPPRRRSDAKATAIT